MYEIHFFILKKEFLRWICYIELIAERERRKKNEKGDYRTYTVDRMRAM
jgi:hypothetical protein